MGRGWVHLLQAGLGREASSEGEAEKERKGHSAGRHGSRQQAGKGRVKRKGGQGKEKQKQPINFPKEKRGGQARGLCAEVGLQAQTSPPLSYKRPLPKQAGRRQRFSGELSHTAAQGLTTKPRVGRQAHRPQAVRETLTRGP